MSVETALHTLRFPEGRRNPYPVYDELHTFGPASPIDPASGERYQVVVNGYDAANEVLRDSAYQVIDGPLLDKAGVDWRKNPCHKALLTSMFFVNGPDHFRFRGAFNRAVTPRRVAQQREPIADIVSALLDQMAAVEDSTVDFMAEFALPLPGDVICRLVGVPENDVAWFTPRAHIFSDLLDIGTSSQEHILKTNEATLELTEYFRHLIASRRREPQDDMLTDLANSGMDDEQLFGNLITFFAAGYASTGHLLGKGVPLLLSHPDAISALSTVEGYAEQCVDEILRIEPPTHFAVRYAVEDREIAGVEVKAGMRVLVLIGAANHDPARYPDPKKFDPTRPDNRPLSFGAGLHFCLGAPLTRLEGIVALPMLFERFPKLSLAGDPVWTDRMTLHGYHSLPVALNQG